MAANELHKFLFEGLAVRGMLVRLSDGWQELLRRRSSSGDWPAPVRRLMGEMTAASTLLQANIKFDGALILQIFGDGPVKLAVAEAQPDLGFRTTAKVVGEVPADAGLPALVHLHGQGRCAITLDPKHKPPGVQPYQGIVALHDARHRPWPNLAEVLEHYMRQSEQLDTRLVLAADDDVAAGLLIQRVPAEGEGNLGGDRDEDFNRIAHLAATLTREELLGLDVETILRRLFWEEPLRRFEPLQPRFACSCSRERVGHMLKSLGRAEIDSIVAERGDVEIGCEFCGLQYRFDAVDVGELFTPGQNQPPASPDVH